MNRYLAPALVLFASACGGATREPAEYPPVEYTQIGESAQTVESSREPLRDAPLLIEQRSESAIVTVRVVFDAGSSDDPMGREGITRLAAVLAVEGRPGPVQLFARPEALRFDPERGVPAVIAGCRFIGAATLCTVQLTDATLLEVEAEPGRWRVGEMVYVMPSRRGGRGVHCFPVVSDATA